MSCDEATDFVEDSVDPRVQVELERLNVATDEINRLEVDLDEARNYFRQLLSESSSKIEASSKKLGHSIAKARPYYDARLKAKEALRETQKMAASFERANSAHSAAKEMVFLAEEGLKTEGRTFDHAWQEMLNHATMRVNESEAERTACEVEHKRTSQIYQMAEIRVQTMQRTLKKAISKSRPYFELKIHYNQLLEEQKKKVKALEKQVAETKLGYAETLRNLEQISDEIHQSRSHKLKRHGGKSTDETSGNKEVKMNPEDKPSTSKCGEDNKKTFFLDPSESAGMESSLMSKATPTSGSSIPDTDVWSEASDAVSEGIAGDESASSGSNSSLTGVPDSESEDEVHLAVFPNSKLKGTRRHTLASTTPSNSDKTESSQLNYDGVGICSFPIYSDLKNTFTEPDKINDSQWTEIKLSPDKDFQKVCKKPNSVLEDDFDIPYAPLSEIENEASTNVETPDSTGELAVLPEKSLASWLSANVRNSEKKDDGNVAKGTPDTPKRMMNIRRQSLDVLWNTATGEKMKEILAQSIMKLNIGSINERRSSESKAPEENDIEDAVEEAKGVSTYEANLSNQFGLQFFSKKSKTDDMQKDESTRDSTETQESSSNQGSFLSRKDKFFTKKVPSPLERTLSFLNADEDSTSDTDSLPSVDLLTDEQLSALVLDQDLSELYQDIVQ